MTFEELATLLGAESSPHQAVLTRVSSLENAGADSIVFASDAKALSAALASLAGAILASKTLLAQAGQKDVRLLGVRDARFAFALAAAKLAEQPIVDRIHPSAILSSGVQIGPGATIAPYAILDEGVVLGAQCVIGSHAHIHKGTILGERVVVQSGAVLGSAGFGYARNPETGAYQIFPQQGTLVIEDDVEIGANTTIDRGALGETRIGRGTKIDNLVHIGHNCIIGKDVIIAAQTGISGSSVIEDGAILGGQVGIGEHATVGEGVILGGGAGVLTGKKMYGKGQIFWGRPARPLKEYLRDLARLRGGGTH